METASILQSEASRRAARGLVEEALLKLPYVETESSLDALHLDRELVENESDPALYLYHAKGDPQQAARSLAGYWKARVQIMGSKRAFLPLHLYRGKGLSKPDIRALKTGIVQILPPDEDGRPVVFYDKTKIVARVEAGEQQAKNDSGDSTAASKVTVPTNYAMARFSLAILSVLAKNEAAVRNGIIILVRIDSREIAAGPAAAADLRTFVHVTQNWVPLPVKLVHMVCFHSGNNIASVNRMIPSFLNGMGPVISKSSVIHLAESVAEAASRLTASGFGIRELPEVLGGLVRTPEDLMAQKSKTGRDSPEVLAREKSDREDESMLTQGNDKPPAKKAKRDADLKSVQESSQERPIQPPAFASAERPRLLSQLEQQHQASEAMKGHVSTLLRSSWDSDLAAAQREIMADPQAVTFPQNEVVSPTRLSSHYGLPGSNNIVDAARLIDHLLVERRLQVVSAQMLQQRQALQQQQRFSSFPASLGAPDSRTMLLQQLGLRNSQMQLGWPSDWSRRPSLLSATGSVASQTSTLQNAEWAQHNKINADTAQAHALSTMESALKLIPVQDKVDYLEATEKVPHLVKAESPFQRFLVCENFDASAAALRLVSYWKRRKALFGDRAFLPMNQTNRGALTDEDLVVLNTGSIAVLSQDGDGRSILCSDRTRMLEDTPQANKARLRATFYLLSVVAERPASQTDGILGLVVLVTPRVMDLNQQFSYEALDLLRSVFPVRVHCMHLAITPPKTGKEQAVQKLVGNTTRLMREMFGEDKVVTHVSTQRGDIAESLYRHGLPPHTKLPFAVGGTWKYDEFMVWLKDRRKKEKHHMAVDSLRNPEMHQFNSETVQNSEKSLTEEEKQGRKKKLNALYSRRKRERTRVEKKALEDEEAELLERNKELRDQNKRLEALLGDANRLVASVERMCHR